MIDGARGRHAGAGRRAYRRVRAAVETPCSRAASSTAPPTFFECATAAAFELFAEPAVDIAVLEVGLGGRLDATNVVTPLVVRDHVDRLRSPGAARHHARGDRGREGRHHQAGHAGGDRPTAREAARGGDRSDRRDASAAPGDRGARGRRRCRAGTPAGARRARTSATTPRSRSPCCGALHGRGFRGDASKRSATALERRRLARTARALPSSAMQRGPARRRPQSGRRARAGAPICARPAGPTRRWCSARWPTRTSRGMLDALAAGDRAHHLHDGADAARRDRRDDARAASRAHRSARHGRSKSIDDPAAALGARCARLHPCRRRRLDLLDRSPAWYSSLIPAAARVLACFASASSSSCAFSPSGLSSRRPRTPRTTSRAAAPTGSDALDFDQARRQPHHADRHPERAVQIDCDDIQLFADDVELFQIDGRFIATGRRACSCPAQPHLRRAPRLQHQDEDRHVLQRVRHDGDPRRRPSPACSARRSRTRSSGARKFTSSGRRSTGSSSGGFTACVQPTPRWEIASGSITLNARRLRAAEATRCSRSRGSRSFTCRSSTTRWKRTTASTGFLMPIYGTSHAQGTDDLATPFFWAISRSHDATLHLRLVLEDRPGRHRRVPLRARPGSSGQRPVQHAQRA